MKVAKTYANYKYDETKAYEKGGKLYVDASCKCDRCSGLGIIVARVENDRYIPIPVDGGICYKCEGKKYIKKAIRLYTDKEYEQMEKAKKRAAEKRKAEQEAKMKAEYAHKKEIWDQHNGFNADGYTYIVVGNSYPIKDQLKEAGFCYNGMLRRWMKGEPTGIPQDYEGSVIKLSADQLVEYSAWGEGHFLLDAKKIVDEEEKKIFPQQESDYVGQIGKRSTFTVTLVRKNGFMGRFGSSNVYNFKDENGNVLVWFSSVNLDKEEGDTFPLTGTIKSYEEYNGIKQTILTRCRCKVKKD